MRKLLVATTMCAGVVMQAQAANLDPYAPEMKAYVNFGFGAPKVKSLGLHYGFRMDHDRQYQALVGRALPALMQLDFTGASGFDSALINGQPFVKRIVQLNADGDPAAPADGTSSGGGLFSDFTVVDWGLLAVGVAGIGFGIAKVAKVDESDDPKTTTTAAGAGNPLAGIPVVGGVVGGVLGGLGLPAVPSSAALPAAPAAVPTTVPSVPLGLSAVPNPVSNITTIPNSPTDLVSGAALPTGALPVGFDDAKHFVIETRDVNYDNWLNAGTGHMGDLIPQ